MPPAQRDPNPGLRRLTGGRTGCGQVLSGVVIAVAVILVSLSAVHCPKGLAALSHAAAHNDRLHSAPQNIAAAHTAGVHIETAERQGGMCRTADVVLPGDSALHGRPLLVAPAVAMAFGGPPDRDTGNRALSRADNINPFTALDGRSLLYRLNVIRR